MNVRFAYKCLAFSRLKSGDIWESEVWKGMALTCSWRFRYDNLGNALSQKVHGYGVPSVTPIVYDICKSSTLDEEVVSLDAVVSLGLHGVVSPMGANGGPGLVTIGFNTGQAIQTLRFE